MLTVKHITLSGAEYLYEALTVRFEPGRPGFDNGHTGQSATPDTLWIRSEVAPDEQPITGGTVFAMNRFGKTVARYDLGASPVPIVGDGLTDPRREMGRTNGVQVSA